MCDCFSFLRVEVILALQSACQSAEGTFTPYDASRVSFAMLSACLDEGQLEKHTHTHTHTHHCCPVTKTPPPAPTTTRTHVDREIHPPQPTHHPHRAVAREPCSKRWPAIKAAASDVKTPACEDAARRQGTFGVAFNWAPSG